ncbi:hypothetical protein [uncultured Hymenobacter sp.]|uniref:hypothetical protein n=1 Tax=uncultured Hymenobacter sp. TaxID=170016 RepID=UPI0035CC3C37
MNSSYTHARIAIVWILPILLLSTTWVIFGCYYETNDDVAITQVVRGETALGPVSNLHLYFHGLSYGLAALYRLLPAIPWYGLLLYALLYISLVLLYGMLFHLLAPTLSLLGITACFIVVYWLTWQETALLMNYTRLPILLVATGTLFAASRRGQFLPLLIGLAIVALGWSIRPSAAVLGLLVAIPGAWWLAGFRATIPLASAGLLIAVATVAVATTYSPVEKTYRQIDMLLVSYTDYSLYQLRPTTAADSLGQIAVDNWALGDSTIVNERFFKRNAYFDSPSFLRQTLVRKAFTFYYLLRNHYLGLILFPIVVGLWLSLRDTWRRHWEFWVAQVLFAAFLLLLATALKLPLRIASPLFSVWTVSTVIYIARHSIWMLHLTTVWRLAFCGALFFYSFAIWHESRMYHRLQEQNEAYMSQVYKLAKQHTLVVGGVEWAYIYLSPFTTYELSDSPVVTLMGWLTLEPSLVELRQHLTGTRDFRESLNRLAATPNTIWMMRDSFASYLQLYMQRHNSNPATTLRFVSQQSLSSNSEFAKVYEARVSTR